jgi:hypothetical protein
LKHRLPFVTFGGGGCAPWLADGLERAGVPENTLYWINAYDVRGAATSAEFVKDLRPVQVVAMGKLAERWCVDHMVRHDSVPHPQYWMRFHHHAPYPLFNVLRSR